MQLVIGANRRTGRINPAAPDFADFAKVEASWLDDYALFMAIKIDHAMAPLSQWPTDIRLRDGAALVRIRTGRAAEVLFWKQIQFLAWQQWQALLSYASRQGIRIIGDIPIYVAPDSADLWAHPELFQTGAGLNLTEVAGCPPDAYAPQGQLWGNPLYDWPVHKADGYRWWLSRLSHAGRIYDVVRIDHFRGFESYYAIPGREDTAENGCWRPGPGLDFINTVKRELPGMKVLQFAFGSGGKDYLPYNYPRNCVAYTGTHDNTTSEDWQYSMPAAEVQFARAYIDVSRPEDFTWRLIRTALASPADTCIIPLQDYLNLGSEARINKPGSRENNWQWRVSHSDLTADLSARIMEICGIYGRLH